ncbi:putative uncharacterized protein encoded by LINC01465 [Choloepus didactylus]|uniref:putative uncharacterized protein encoded by LINC01465 n=1 Tax=Choloepus didactylus TaxID=27675 RepID=UPI00189DA522|nr:putative uncharacterized protein encoded by LINC01465 [Choloepus didactylus]
MARALAGKSIQDLLDKSVDSAVNCFTLERLGGGDHSRAASLHPLPAPRPRAPDPPPAPEAPPPARPGPASPSREGGDQAAAAAAGICWKPEGGRGGGRPGGAEGTVPAAELAPQ